MRRALVICVGNTARGDDGVGHEVARLLRSRPGTAADIVTATSLDVTLAEEFAQRDTVVFVDAIRQREPTTAVEPIRVARTGTSTHGLDPQGLVTLAATLFEARPDAWLVTVAAPDMEHTEELSETAIHAAVEAADLVKELVGDVGDRSGRD